MKDYSFEEPFEKYPLAMAYVPWQHFTQMYENLEKGYKAGTIFPELDNINSRKMIFMKMR